MLKNKLLIYLFFLIYFLFSFWKIDAFLDEDSWLDLYKNIDEGISELELKYFEVTLTNDWETTIAKRINAIMWEECIKESITIEDFKEIAWWTTKKLYDLIKDECKDDEWESVKASRFQKLFNVISGLDLLYLDNANEKTKLTYNISRLWLYSDWNTDNSPYDIVSDLEEINWIIFSLTDDTKYKWTDTTKLSDFLWGSSNNSNSNSSSNNSSSSSSSSSNSSSSSSSNSTSNSNNSKCTPSTSTPTYINWYTCSNTTSKSLSGLNYSSLYKIINSIEDNWDSSYDDSWDEADTTECWTWDEDGDNWDSWDDGDSGGWSGGWGWGGWGWASSVDVDLKDLSSLEVNDDNSKCDDFFCIEIEYKKNEHSLFWWWNKKDKTIEWIMKNSNNHLFKYANSSLYQHKITLDNWELSIKELKLSDIFNLNYIVFYREIPIINSETNKEKNKKVKDNTPFSMKNLLEYYFNLYWLEFERANSIDDFLKTIEELKTLNDSADWQILNVPKKYGQFVIQSIEDKENEKELNKLLSTKQRVDNVDYLYWLFVELSSFTTTFEIYVQQLRQQVLKMDEKASR